MSELQNKIVALIQLRRGLQSLVNAEERRRNFICHAIAIYQGMGGRLEDLPAIASTSPAPNKRMDEEIGDTLFELAAIGHLWDVDVIQASYNRIDAEIAKVSSQRRKRLPKAREVA